MQPNVPQGPPPMAPPQGNNPYDFIVNPGSIPKKKLGLPSGNSKGQRVLIIVGGVILLIVAASFILNLLGSGSKKARLELITVAQKQTELIRIADIGMKKARNSEAKNLAITTKLTIMSEQPVLVSTINKLGKKVDTKQLVLGKNTKTDQLLTQAEQSNNFDDVFIKEIQSELTDYAKATKTAYNNNQGKKTKDALALQFKNAATLANFKEE